MKKIVTLIIIVLCAATLFAQAPEKFSYQAVVRNASNALVTDAQVSVRVSILQGSAEGEVLYVETHSAVTNANGLLTLEIGGGKTEQGAFDRINWANGPYFLKTETDPNGGTNYSVTSTQQLLSVPYALYAKEAANSFSGDYNDLKNKPAIPQNVGELTNDAGYITLSDLPAQSKSGGVNDAGVVQTTTCGELDLCAMANQLAQQQAQLARMETVLLPKVTTASVSNVTETAVDCGGTVTANGYDAVTSRGVCWGTEPNPTVSGSHTYNGSATGTFTCTIMGLAQGTTYYVRAYATNSMGTAYGAVRSFTTLVDTCPTITLPYSEDFESYTTTTTASTGVRPDCWKLVREDVAMTDATRPQLYYKSSFAHSGNYSLKMENRCVYAMPALSEDVLMNHVRMEMYLRQANAVYQLEVGVWEDNGTFVPVALFNNNATGVIRVECDFSSYTGRGRRIAFRNVLGGTANYNYSYNYIDDIALDTVLSGNTTAMLPTVTTGAVSSITATTAISGGEVTTDGDAEVAERGVCWATEPNPTVDDNHTSDGTGMGTFTSSLTDLTSGTTYYVRAYATNSVGTAYGEEVSFTTMESQQDTCATISLAFSEDFESYTTSTTAATGVQPDCWQLVREDVPMTEAKRPQLYCRSDFAHSGNYSLKMENRCVYAMPALSDSVELNQVRLEMYLRQPNASYRLQVGVWEESGTFVSVATFNNSTTDVERVVCDFSNYSGNGRRIAFRNVLGGGVNYNYSYNYLDDIIIVTLPTVTTGSVSEITVTWAACNGEVTDDGGAEVTKRGVCWSTEPSPTIDGEHTSDGGGTGTFMSNLTGLESNTTYYVRAYATNSVGTAYGEVVSFTTLALPDGDAQPCPGAETVTDYDGNVYNTVKIGEQCWMRENLRTLHYADGMDAYGWYDTNNVAICGISYSWSEAMHEETFSYAVPSGVQGICPTGWHLPSSAEWTQLTDYLGSVSAYQCDGGSGNIAKALASTEGWIEDNHDCTVGNNQNANNASGFTAVPTVITDDYEYYDYGKGTHFLSTSMDAAVALDYNKPDVHYSPSCNFYLFCYNVFVRCLRNEGYPFSIVTTVPVSNVTLTTAECGGEVISDNGSEVTERGVCWSTEPSPTVGNSHASAGSGGMGTFTIQLADLFPNTTYYVRAYTVNSLGTSYGEEVIFTTLSPDIPIGDAQPCQGAETLTDYDGNVYNTVKIGQQCWMKENLKTLHYANGENVGSLSFYDDFYSWRAVMHGTSSSDTNPSGVQGVCPDGWHLPSNAEWTQLIDYMSSVPAYQCSGGSENIAKALASTEGWLASSITCGVGNNLTANNASGFSALPLGYYIEGYFTFGREAAFWSASSSVFTLHDSTVSEMILSESELVSDWDDVVMNTSVRCLRN